MGACAQGDAAETPDVASSTQALTARAVSTPTSSPAEISARAAIAAEDVGGLTAARARDYRAAEIAALKAALVTRRAALAQAQNGRPTKASAERDQLDQEIATMRSRISDNEQKLQTLSAQSN
jgi:hypothetical protein